VRELSRLEVSLVGGSMLPELHAYMGGSLSFSLTRQQCPLTMTSLMAEAFLGWLLKRDIAVQGLQLPFSRWPVRCSPWTPSPCPGTLLTYAEVRARMPHATCHIPHAVQI
jgi:hypothetical protein